MISWMKKNVLLPEGTYELWCHDLVIHYFYSKRKFLSGKLWPHKLWPHEERMCDDFWKRGNGGGGRVMTCLNWGEEGVCYVVMYSWIINTFLLDKKNICNW